MRIAFVHWGYPPVVGGVETHLYHLCPALVRLGHRVSLLTGSHSEAKAEYVEHGVRIKRLPILDLNWLARRGLASLEREVRQEISAFLESSRAELVHAHNMHYFSELHATILREETRKRNIPLILTAHNVWDDQLFLSIAAKIQWDHVIAVSHYIKRALEGYGMDEKRTVVIHHGIDGKPFFQARREVALQKYPPLRGKQIIFHPARMGLAKGNHIAIQAFRLIKKQFPQAILVMAGTKNIIDWVSSQERDIAFLLQLLDNFGLRRDTLIDSYPIEFMPAMYAVADVCVYPSVVHEPFGITMLEAMAAGKPMIVSRMGGMPEVIQHGVNGFIVEPANPRALANTIARLLSDRKLAKKVGQGGLKAFRQKYYLERMVDQIVSVYQLCLLKK